MLFISIDVARWLGAEVIAAASTEVKRAAALQAGAVAVLDSSVENVNFRELAGFVWAIAKLAHQANG